MYSNLDLSKELYEDVSQLVNVLQKEIGESSKNIDIEFEIRAGKFEEKVDSRFTPGVSYEEFSRFYTFMEENYQIKTIENYLDIYTKELKDIRITITGKDEIMNYCKLRIVEGA